MPQDPVPAVQDLSPRVVELARQIDRLPPGQYEIGISKPDVRAGSWDVEIVRVEKIVSMKLNKHQPME